MLGIVLGGHPGLQSEEGPRSSNASARTQPANAACRRNRQRLPRELLVLDPVRDRGVDAQAALLVLFVIREVALEPLDMAVALEGQDVRRDAIKEPAIVADDDSAA